MSHEATDAPDLEVLAGELANALAAAGFDFERPSLAAGLRGYGEWLRAPVPGLVFQVDRTPELRDLWGTTVEAFDAVPAVWIGGELRREPAIGAALADDRPVAAELRCNGMRIKESLSRGRPRSARPGLPP